MKKTNVTISLDQDCYVLAKETIPNLSGFLNDVLKDTLEEGNPEAKQVFSLRKYLDNLEKETKNKEEALNELDIEIEKKNKAKNEGLCGCGSVAYTKRNDITYCRSCFLNLT